jgi:hypothetical protein
MQLTRHRSEKVLLSGAAVTAISAAPSLAWKQCVPRRPVMVAVTPPRRLVL